MVVDGANVVGSRPDGWWRDRAGAAARLHERLVAAALPDDEVVLVLEGAARQGLAEDDLIVEVASERVAAGRAVTRQCAGPGSTSSTSTPPASLGWTKFTRLPAVPRRGSSYSSRSPRLRRTAATCSTSVTR
jgi:hypothetical protein